MRKKISAALLVIWCLLLPAFAAAAESQGEPVAGHENIAPFIHDSFQAATSGTEVLFPYHPNNVYKVYCQEGFLTDFRFEKGEQITFVGGGDTSRWIIQNGSVGKGSRAVEHLYVKPSQRGISTNIIINTNRRSYQVQVVSASFYNPSVAWIVEERLSTQNSRKQQIRNYLTLNPAKLNFSYTFDRKNWDWAPIRVFDDGKKTYLLMKPTIFATDAPAFFVLSKKNEIVLVNYRVAGGYYIVDRLFDKAVLQVGKDRITIKRKKQ